MTRTGAREVEGVMRRKGGVRGHLPRTDAREAEGVMRRKEGVRGHLTRLNAREAEELEELADNCLGRMPWEDCRGGKHILSNNKH